MRKKKCIYIRNGTLFDLALNSQNKNYKKMDERVQRMYILILGVEGLKNYCRITVPAE